MPRASRPTGKKPGHWALQDAKARFSELVRLVHQEGPQHVTVHGRDEVVIITADEFRRLKGAATGRVLIDALQDQPGPSVTRKGMPMPVRDVTL